MSEAMRRIACDGCRHCKGLYSPRSIEGGCRRTAAQIYTMCRASGRTWLKPAREALMGEAPSKACPGYEERQ